MKNILLTMLMFGLFGLPCSAQTFAGHSYETSFPATENPIAEAQGGQPVWQNGAQAPQMDWTNMRSTGGKAFGTQPRNGNYDDSTALLTGTWGPNQTASMTVAQTGSANELEVEIRLRSSWNTHSATGYECDVAPGYTVIVRWNGPLGSYKPLTALGPGAGNGDVITCSVSGTNPTTIVMKKNGSTILTASDNGSSGNGFGAFGPWTSGNPGIGWFTSARGDANASDYAISHFIVSDGATATLQPPTSLHVTVQ